jgi:folate-dependent tRNA-U54 methylase TrmFO/GidA
MVEGIENLFCAGEKAGLLVGHTEAICTGTLAGHNASRLAAGKDPVVLPDSTAVGDAIGYVRKKMREEGELGLKFTFSGSVFFNRMVEREMYTTDVAKIVQRVDKAGLRGLFG